MIYDNLYNDEVGWIVEENEFNTNYQGKCETIMALGNGYMGIRSATEENYLKQTRNAFVAGTFNKFFDNEVTELPNVADVIGIDLKLNGENFNLNTGKILNYSRKLNLKTGELTRSVEWESNSKDIFKIDFKRFVSLDNLHLVGQNIEITPLNCDLKIELQSKINAQMTNSGVQHFSEEEKRLYDGKYLQLVQKTIESKISFVFNLVHNFYIDKNEYEPKAQIYMDRRIIGYNYTAEVEKGKTLEIDKLSNVHTTRDKETETLSFEELKKLSYDSIKEISENRYEYHLEQSAKAWENKIWSINNIEINTEKVFDKLAIRFAVYHLTVMTPAHDNRMNIGAKGLTGEGYKGHTFWDTEIFMLPFFTYSNPKVARSLLEYRYNTLKGAHKKATENNYEGAMFPWESAWLEDGEVTPVWGAVDIVTGKATKIWSGFIEQHITSDVAFGCWQYFKVTNDVEFMDNYGYELFMDTAKFWQSRLEWDEEKGRYHINNVIGPDEYKEHINNNAFTNYTAHWAIKNAIEYYDILKKENIEVFNRLNEKLNLEDVYAKWINKVDKIYLPQPREEDLVIPQDDTYLQKEIIDLSKYKNQKNVGTMFLDYNLEQVNNIQVSKQADIMILFLLLENLFEKEVKNANFNYYEPKTLHDSSLSLSTHCILANDLKHYELSYELFERATKIDLGSNMKTSDHGIHAAALGGLWQCVVNGFSGIKMLDGKLYINPNLPEVWSGVKFNFFWHGDMINIDINKNEMTLKNITKNNSEIQFTNNANAYNLKDELVIKF